MAKVQNGAVLRPLRVLMKVGPLAGLSDAQLLERFMGADREVAELAFAAIIDRHGPMVRRICRQMLGNLHDGQDAFQAAFFILARKARSVRTRDSLASWLHGRGLPRLSSCSVGRLPAPSARTNGRDPGRSRSVGL